MYLHASINHVRTVCVFPFVSLVWAADVRPDSISSWGRFVVVVVFFCEIIIYAMRQRARAGNLTVCYLKKTN